MKFFRTPVLLENLLPYLDSGSTFCLVQAKISCILNLLQKTTDTETGTVQWNKLVKRSLPEDFKIDDDNLSDVVYYARVREAYDENRVSLLALISILKTMDDATAINSHMLHLLDVICEKGVPDKRQGLWRGPYMKIKIGCPRHSGHWVSPQAFLLLETVEAAFETSIQEVASIDFPMYHFEEPLWSAVAARVARQQQQMTMMAPHVVVLRTEACAEALLTLIKASAIGGFPFSMVLNGNIGAEGWAALAEAIKLIPGKLLHAKSVNSVEWMREARREDLRAIWDGMGGMKWVSVGGLVYHLTEEGRREALEKLLDNN